MILSKKKIFFKKVPKSGICRFSVFGFTLILSKKLENVPKPIFFAHILKKSYSKINLRIFFCIFGDFQNFQISRFQIPENLEIVWKWLFFTNCNILGIFPTQYESLSLVFISEYLNSHFAGISRFQIPENLEMVIFD